MKNGADLDRELEALGRMICPEPRQEARRLVERRRRRRFRLISPPFLSQQHLRRLSPVLAAVAAVMLIGGPLALNLAGNHAGSDPLAHLLAPLGREADANDHGDLFGGHVVPVAILPLNELRPQSGSGASGARPVASGSQGRGPSQGNQGGGLGHSTGTPPSTPGGECSQAVSTLDVGTDHASYPADGRTVTVNLTLHNFSSGYCTYWLPPCGLFVEVLDSNANTVYDSRNTDALHCQPVSQNNQSQNLPAGQSLMMSFEWNQTACGVQVPVGSCPKSSQVGAGTYAAIGGIYESAQSGNYFTYYQHRFTLT